MNIKGLKKVFTIKNIIAGFAMNPFTCSIIKKTNISRKINVLH